MNIYQQINEVLKEIETNLTEKLTLEHLAKVAALTTSSLQIIFPLLTGVGLKEYIRKRRMTLAALDLQAGHKVVDVAIKYQYESAISFSRAFVQFHGLKPSEIKRRTEEVQQSFCKITLAECTPQEKIEYRLMNKKEFSLYTKSTIVKQPISKITTKFWNQIKKEHPIFLTSEKRIGFLDETTNLYYCGLEQKFENAELIKISSSDYFVFTIFSREATDIITAIQKAEQIYLESIAKKTKHEPILEVYYPTRLEIWVPIY